MKKNLHDKILKDEFKEQHLSTVPKSYSNLKHDFLGKKNEVFCLVQICDRKGLYLIATHMLNNFGEKQLMTYFISTWM